MLSTLNHQWEDYRIMRGMQVTFYIPGIDPGALGAESGPFPLYYIRSHVISYYFYWPSENFPGLWL